SDLPASKRTWWLVSDGEEVDLCPTDPGFEVGLYVATDLRTLTRVIMGDVSMKSAVVTGQIELDDPPQLRHRLEGWLGQSSLAGVGGARCSMHARRNRDRSDRRHSMHVGNASDGLDGPGPRIGGRNHAHESLMRRRAIALVIASNRRAP